MLISPPAWGWPDGDEPVDVVSLDFPTCVGMARLAAQLGWDGFRFPHLRGDGPDLAQGHPIISEISPPAWGWPVLLVVLYHFLFDFPTCVGMARATHALPSYAWRFPHLRGDGPWGQMSRTHVVLISPPAWGWPATTELVRLEGGDFPTCVGMARVIRD